MGGGERCLCPEKTLCQVGIAGQSGIELFERLLRLVPAAGGEIGPALASRSAAA
jgi:hypothetical protein